MLNLLVLLVASLILIPVLALENRIDCVTSEEEIVASQDFFPNKVQPLDSEFWNISYHGTYKIFTNKASNLTYLLYQCGSSPPPEELEDGRHANIISIPPSNGVIVASTPMIAYLELLGLRTEIKGFLGAESFISSPCVLEMIDSGLVNIAPDGVNKTILAETGLLSDDFLTIINGWTGDVALNNTIIMEEYTESSYAGTMEWIKAYGAIFNLEEKANLLFEEANCRFDSIAENVAIVTSDMPDKPKILWAYWSDYCQGWDVAECPNYYCDFAAVCNAEILNSTQGSVDTCSVPYMTTEEFLAFGKDADHWIYPSINWNSVYAENAAALDEFKSVKAESVYDYQGGGENAWFEQRFAEYDIVLNDFCLVAGTIVSTSPSNRRIWFRNVFTEPVGTLEQCDNPDDPYEPRENVWSNCGDLSEEAMGEDKDENGAGDINEDEPQENEGASSGSKSSIHGTVISAMSAAFAL